MKKAILATSVAAGLSIGVVAFSVLNTPTTPQLADLRDAGEFQVADSGICVRMEPGNLPHPCPK